MYACGQWNEEWREERERLEQLLTPDELDSALATTRNAHYTAPAIIRAMYALLQRLGFVHGRILEPACGLGHCIGLIPEEMHARSRKAVTHTVINGTTTVPPIRISKAQTSHSATGV